MAPKSGPAQAFLLASRIPPMQAIDERKRPSLDSFHNGIQPEGALMKPKQLDWPRTKLAHVYLDYHSAIRARSKEGRAYLMHAFRSVLIHEGLKVERIGPQQGQPFDPQTGAGYLLVEGCILLDLLVQPRLTPQTVREVLAGQARDLPHNPERFLLTFGHRQPQGYPGPMSLATWERYFDPLLAEEIDPLLSPYLIEDPILIGESDG
jgi:hypothetical protein